MDPAITSASEISGIERALDAMRRLAEDSDRGEVNLLDSFLVLDSDPTVSDGDLFLIVPSDAGPRCTNWDTINSVVLYEAHTSAERINAALDLYVAGKADSPLFVSEDLCACIRDLISRITASVPLIGFAGHGRHGERCTTALAEYIGSGYRDRGSRQWIYIH